ncbi:PAS domain S-box [Desulfocurvibacter africanus PCS]|uniref:Sensory/regulatory protein RpfC n=1 Tax=Desulfocurvibacter africanus PCS TaxID=1262666 RepID=M5PQ07_DESAF|nr:PAS domain-containing hybrid sensor histidine kinase/response regulator [Desulfocurvibacter africanus]EMG36397.1 PAS domain S-box [Desulfocurvibacter africanus PCS]
MPDSIHRSLLRLAENSRDIIAVVSLPSGYFVYVSPSIEAITGYTREEAMQFPFFLRQVIHPEWQYLNDYIIEEALQGKLDFFGEFPFMHKSGEMHWASMRAWVVTDPAGKPIAMEAIAQDVTERKKAEEGLRKQEELLRKFVENAPVSIAMFDTQMRHLEASQRWLAQYELVGQDLRGRSHYEIIPDIPEKWKRIHRRSLAGSVESAQFDPFERADGSVLWANWETRPWRTADGEIGGIILFCEDVTETVQLQEALHQARQEAESANSAKSDFLASMSHEIRTPMNGILGLTELALMQEPRGKVREYLGLVRQSAYSLLDIINDILDLSKIEAGRVELAHADFNLREMFESLFVAMRIAAERKGLAFTTVIDPDVPPWLRGDEGRLRQIFCNLIGNAIKFTEAGEVLVCVGLNDPLDSSAVIESGKPARINLLASVKDTGIGIPMDMLGRIFEPFDTGARRVQHNGTGLGLSITKRLLDLMNGTITVQSEPGRGSTFTFRVNLEPATDEVAHAPAIQPAQRPSTRPLHVLLAEDNEINRFLAMELFLELGHEVTAVENGKGPWRPYLGDGSTWCSWMCRCP